MRNLERSPSLCEIFGIDDLIMGGMSMAGGLMQYGMQNSLLDKQQAFAAQQAAQQMAFQKDMATHSYQYGMQDMKAAGLNPILAYQKGGAPSPSGAMAGTPTAQPVPDIIGAGIASARAGSRLNAELENLKEQNMNIQKDTRKKVIEGDVGDAKIPQIKAETELAKTQNNLSAELVQKAAAEAKKANFDASVYQNNPAWKVARELGLIGGEANTAISPIVSGVGAASGASRAVSTAKAVKFKDRFYFGD